MLITFLYCIDFPSATDQTEVTNRLAGWLLCSHKIVSLDVLSSNNEFIVEYGHARDDVYAHFKSFSYTKNCGLAVTATKKYIPLKEPLLLEIHLETPETTLVCVNINLHLQPGIIRTLEVDTDALKVREAFNKTEVLFEKTLKKHPCLTIRMDITNKCNLKCIMCHYKEESIYSRPTQAISDEQLKHNLKDIAPFVKSIMLSCGYEPLMSRHFHSILHMLYSSYPHIEIAFCTNAMLLNSKARKSTIENNVDMVVLSIDGVKANTVERIRKGSSFKTIISNILALQELKKQYKISYPQLLMDFVLMNSNIHEAPAFVEMCSLMGIEVIDFRHLVGNVFFNEHEEMLSLNKAKYNHFRPLIIEASKKHNIKIRLPEPYLTNDVYVPEVLSEVNLSDFFSIHPDIQTETISLSHKIKRLSIPENAYSFLAEATCMRPFNEIMINENGKILPCSYYNDPMGWLSNENNLYNIFFSEEFKEVRRRKLFNRFDHNCLNCPIKHNLLPSDFVK